MILARLRLGQALGWALVAALAAVTVHALVSLLEAARPLAEGRVSIGALLARGLPEAMHVGLPLSALLGALLAEGRAAGRGESAAAACAGAGPRHRAVAPLVLGLLVGAASHGVESGPLPASRAARRAEAHAGPAAPAGPRSFVWSGGVLLAARVGATGTRLEGVRLLPRSAVAAPLGDERAAAALSWREGGWHAEGVALAGTFPEIPAFPEDLVSGASDPDGLARPALADRIRRLEGVGRPSMAERAVAVDRLAWAGLCPGLALVGAGLGGRRSRRESLAPALVRAGSAALALGCLAVVLGAAARAGAVPPSVLLLGPAAALAAGAWALRR